MRHFKSTVFLVLLLVLGAPLTGCMIHHYQQSQLAGSLRDSATLPLPEYHGTFDPIANSLDIRLVSFNVWALPVYLPGSERTKRLSKIPPALMQQQADIITLQEAFEPLFREHLDHRLGAYNSVSDFSCTRDTWPFGLSDCSGGLATFSRCPVIDHEFVTHSLLPDAKWDEAGGEKGFELTVIKTPLSEIVIVNVHLYAGRNQEDEAQRKFQVAGLIEKLRKDDLFRFPIILMGDINSTHPGLTALGIQQAESSALAALLEAGFVMHADTVKEEDLTYDVEANQYANLWFNRFEQRQIFDYMLFYAPTGYSIELETYERSFDEKPLLSDHYGLTAEITLLKELNSSL